MASDAGTSGDPAGGRAARVVLIVGLALLALAIAFGGTRAKRSVLGSNGIGKSSFVAVLGPDRVLCQVGQVLPQGTGRLRMTIGTYDAAGPPLRVAVQDDHEQELLPPGSLAAGWKQGVVDVPLGAVASRPLGPARICIANRGNARLAFAGADFGMSARIAGRRAPGRVRIEYVRGDRRSGWSLAGSIASRMTFGRGLWDGVAPWAALVFVLVGVVAATRALAWAQRGEEREPA